MDSIKYRDGYKYQLAEDYQIQTTIYPKGDIITEYISLTMQGLLTVKEGYSWDGASGPTIDTKSSMRAGLVHDALYQLMRQELISQTCRKIADEMLRDIMLEDVSTEYAVPEGASMMSKIMLKIEREAGLARARTWFWAVRKFAMSAANPENDKKVMCAP